MKILFAIPHYYGPGPEYYGSTDESQRNQRIAVLQATIRALHQHLSARQRLAFHLHQETAPTNQAISNSIDIVICTTGNHHLLSALDLPSDCYVQHSVAVDNPLNLGFACYDIFKHAFGQYDWYCYLEDDLLLTDPLFFLKMQAFYATVQNARYLLQPHRYETCDSLCSKYYTDGKLWDDSVMEKARLPNSLQQIDVPFLSTTFRMLPAENPHAGCFFLTEAHLQELLRQPWYGKPNSGFVGTLESAATLAIFTAFHIFKPAPECAGFLELCHSHKRSTKNGDPL